MTESEVVVVRVVEGRGVTVTVLVVLAVDFNLIITVEVALSVRMDFVGVSPK